MGYHTDGIDYEYFTESSCEICVVHGGDLSKRIPEINILKAQRAGLTSIVNKLLKAADVQTSVDDLVGSDSLQNTIAKQIKERLEQARGHGEVLDLYKQKTHEMERTLKELEELKKEIGGTKAEKEEAKRKIQEQEEKLKNQETSLKAKESENEEYNNIAEQMLSMQLEIERLKKENKQLKRITIILT